MHKVYSHQIELSTSYRFQDISAQNQQFSSYFSVAFCQYRDRRLTFGKLAYIY